MSRVPAGYLLASEAAAALGITAASVRRAVREGRLPAYRAGRVLLIDKRAVAAYARRRGRGRARG